MKCAPYLKIISNILSVTEIYFTNMTNITDITQISQVLQEVSPEYFINYTIIITRMLHKHYKYDKIIILSS